jgi:tRNA uridine 5-carboxymethylaminomethyl modification enzyme
MFHVKHEVGAEMDTQLKADVVVIGGGHAGTEAAAAAARLGAKTILITHQWETVGAMSCNPAIGGLGKGHLVREIDALDGVMGRAADQGGIQFRVLNRRKGPAVQGPRAQQDRTLYALAVKAELKHLPLLSVLEAEVTDLDVDDDTVRGVVLSDGRSVGAGAVVLTTGTFLRGTIHIGDQQFRAGRMGEQPSDRLAERFRTLGLVSGRLKTGTPARLDRQSIDWDDLEQQSGDDPPEPFSALTRHLPNQQITCAISRTTPAMHALINANLHRSAMYGGMIEGRGPRYCPSIEDKVVRFADRDSHQVFLEPEGIDSQLVYPNGLSTSLPEDVQEQMFRLMPGLSKARIVKPGYAIEYDYCDPRALFPDLQSQTLRRLFLAGQINGTTGYEEAAAQGLVAGLNAARLAGAMSTIVMDRAQSYIGVMIDDLVTLGVSEPYRMFTSRSEFRLALRSDNADLRLTEFGTTLGLVRNNRSDVFMKKQRTHREATDALHASVASPKQFADRGIAVNQDGRKRSAFELLSYPDIRFQTLFAVWPQLQHIPNDLHPVLAADARYSVYLERQRDDWESMQADALLSLEGVVSYGSIPGLSNELSQKLQLIRPRNISQASRIEGMTPAALALLASRAKRESRQHMTKLHAAS